MNETLKILKALSDPTRLRLVALLLRRDLCVCEMMYVLRSEQSRLSHQLRVLREAGLVEDRREGRWINYRLTDRARRLLERPLAEELGLESKNSRALSSDISRLKLCIKQDVRRKKGPVVAHPVGKT